MRLLHILNHLHNTGNGIVNLAVDLALEQSARGNSVAFASGEGTHQELLARHGIEFFHLEQSKNVALLAPRIYKLRRIIKQFKPDLIHAHMRAGVLLAWPCCKLAGIPLVAHLHNVHDRESLLMGLADRVIAVSTAVSLDMQRQGIAAKKLRVVLNGTLNSPRTLPFDQIQPEPLLRPSISTVAGMNERKGISELMQAFNLIAGQFPAAHLYLVGDGPSRPDFEREAAALPCAARIHFSGYQALPQSFMLATDVFVLASRRESFGLVLTEARQAGCAIVATDVDGIPEALDGGAAGLLVPPKDPQALADAMRSLLIDPALASALTGRARQGLERFTTETMAREVQKVYQELL